MSILDLVRPELRVLTPYAAAEQVGDTTRLNANESPYARGGNTWDRPLNRYPEIRPRRLAALLADRYACKPEQLLVTRGSSEAIDLLVRIFCRAGIDNVVIPTPTFSMYEHYATVQGVRVEKVPLDAEKNYRLEAGRVIAVCDESSKLVFVCTPNNPTGIATPLDDIRAIAEARRDQSVIIVDEAYIEYAGASSAISLLDDFDNIVVLRTLSKALGLAGARCGAMISCNAIARQADAIQAPYSLATPVVESVLRELQEGDTASYDLGIRTIIDERVRVIDRLTRLRCVEKVFPSDANFILVRFANPASAVRDCRLSGILIRELGSELDGCVRITIGTPDENDRLLTVLGGPEEACA